MNDEDGNMVIKCVYCEQPLIKIDKPYNIKFYTGFSIQCSSCHAGTLRSVEKDMGFDNTYPLTTKMLYEFFKKRK